MYTLFVFPQKISLVSKTDHALNVLQCIDHSIGNPSVVQDMIRTYAAMSIKQHTSLGDFYFNRSIDVGLLICMGDDNEVDVKSFEKSLLDFLDSLDEENVRIQIVRPSVNKKVEKVNELKGVLEDMCPTYYEGKELVMIPLESLQYSLGLPTVYH